MSNYAPLTFEPMYKGSPIMTNRYHNQGCRMSILDKIKTIFDYMTATHNKVFFMRLDVRYPVDFNAAMVNDTFINFEANFKKHLKRHGLDPHSVWVREQSREKHQHYHMILLLDGNKTQSIYTHVNKAEELWTKALGLDEQQAKGLIDNCTRTRNGYPQQNGIMLRRDDPEYNQKLDDCMRWASYLAKDNTKHNTPKGVRAFGGSSVASHCIYPGLQNKL